MRIGYFGGSFDPPHLGHLAVARAARDSLQLTRLLLAPTGRQPFKPGGPLASFADRLAMTALLCDREDGMESSSIDAPRPDGMPNYTAETLRHLRAELPADAALFAIVGVDAFLGIHAWKETAALFEFAEWIVVSRPGFVKDQLERMPLLPEQRARVHLLEGVAEPASATEVRARLRQGERCDDLLTPAVSAYIEERGLYK